MQREILCEEAVKCMSLFERGVVCKLYFCIFLSKVIEFEESDFGSDISHYFPPSFGILSIWLEVTLYCRP